MVIAASNIPRLRVSAVSKQYGATRALDAVDLAVARGEVHAIVGENGAGKSTLMKIIAGAVRPDSGTMTLDGAAFDPADPLAARRAGVAMIHQELCLAPHLSVEANLALGQEDHAQGVLRRGTIRRRAHAALARLQRSDIDPRAIVGDLSPGARQMVEIARALMTDARVLVMDEPTSSLDLPDIERLFEVIDALKRQGVSILYISHFLDETLRVSDRFTVLRDGRMVHTGSTAATTAAQIIEWMIGRTLAEDRPPTIANIYRDQTAALEARNVRGRDLPRDASFRVFPGEILGIAGLVGAGRTEMLREIFGLEPMLRGEVRLNGSIARPRTPRARLHAGIGLLSEDRSREGLALDMTIAANITLGGLRPLARCGVISASREREAAARCALAMNTRMRDVAQRVGELSGGNQQKVALARLLHRDVDVWLLDEPTRGIDVASRQAIYSSLRDLAAAGKAIVIVSSATSELLCACDRIMVMHRGCVVAERLAGAWTESELTHACVTGAAPSSGGAHAA